MSPAARAWRSDVVRRAASRGGTLRCAEARRVAYRDVDKSYASHRRPQHGAVARRLQDSAAAIKGAGIEYATILERRRTTVCSSRLIDSRKSKSSKPRRCPGLFAFGHLSGA